MRMSKNIMKSYLINMYIYDIILAISNETAK